MKKLLQGMMLTCAAVATPVMAQTVTYACQYVESGGFDWTDEGWKLKYLALQKPFFLTAVDGSLMPPVLDKSRINEVDYLEKSFAHPLFGTTCKDPRIIAVGGEYDDTTQACSGNDGQSLFFNFDALTGATSDLLGSVTPAQASEHLGKVGNVSVATFTCQVVR